MPLWAYGPTLPPKAAKNCHLRSQEPTATPSKHLLFIGEAEEHWNKRKKKNHSHTVAFRKTLKSWVSQVPKAPHIWKTSEMVGTATLPAHREPRASLPSKPITSRMSERENTSSNGLFFQLLPGKWICIPRKESIRLPAGGTDWQKEPLLYHSSTYRKGSLDNTTGKSRNAGASIQHNWLQKHFLGRLSNLPDLPV